MTATLTTMNPNGDDAWFVDWIKLNFEEKEFECPVSGWLDNGDDAAGPGSRTVECRDTGFAALKGT